MLNMDIGEDMAVLSEEYLMELLCDAGAARSAVMEAIKLSRKGDICESLNLLKTSDDLFNKVHKKQTELIGLDEGEGKIVMTLILTHIQDHIMTGMLCRDMANEIIELYKRDKDRDNA
jgi:cellobiose PTS system EIIA component